VPADVVDFGYQPATHPLLINISVHYITYFFLAMILLLLFVIALPVLLILVVAWLIIMIGALII
jgi:hypothetical protein